MWSGTAVLRPGWAVFTGTAGDHAPHRHPAVQVAVGIAGPVAFWSEPSGRCVAAGAVIPADCPHRLDAGPAPLLLLYLEREFILGRALDDWCDRRAQILSDAQTRHLRTLLGASALDGEIVGQAVDAIMQADSTHAPAAFSDARIARSIAELPRPLPERVTLANVARAAGLSPGRYAHLFRAHTGMPLRPYLRWLRLQQALSGIAGGASLTDAAHAAGFADSAHLSRTFRSTFGIAPSVLTHPAVSLHAAG